MRNGYCLLTLVALALAACANTAGERVQRSIIVETEPAGARADLSSGLTCTTPCRLDATDRGYLEMRFSKPGCITQTHLIAPPAAWDGPATARRTSSLKARLACEA